MILQFDADFVVAALARLAGDASLAGEASFRKVAEGLRGDGEGVVRPSRWDEVAFRRRHLPCDI